MLAFETGVEFPTPRASLLPTGDTQDLRETSVQHRDMKPTSSTVLRDVVHDGPAHRDCSSAAPGVWMKNSWNSLKSKGFVDVHPNKKLMIQDDLFKYM